MKTEIALRNELHAAFEREPRIDLHHSPIELECDADDVLTLTGTLKNIAAKKLALELAAAAPGVRGIVDRLRVAPAARMEDGEIRDHLRAALVADTAFRDCMIQVQVKGQLETVQEPPAEVFGDLVIIVEDGSVLLEGEVPSLSHKRLAGVLAWWVPGSTNVLNCLEVVPPQTDNADELRDAVRLVLEKDPFVNAEQIRVTAKDRVVTMQGLVPSADERAMAEFDVWYVFGVDKVINQIELQA